MKVKVCGMTQVAQVASMDALGVDFVGFIFYPKSPRYVLDRLYENEIKVLRGNFKKVGVFVNATEDEIRQRIDSCGLDMVQLHGDETPSLCEKISENVPVIKAFRLLNQEDVLYKIAPYSSVADYFLFDADTVAFGGSGRKFDWKILKDLEIDKPFFLSGGIGDQDVESIRFFTKQNVAKDLFSLDINSRFESSPGVKDVNKIEAFLKQIKSIEA